MTTIPTCTRRFTIDAAHRVLEHGSKCKYNHGHRYEIEITCHSTALDALGMVIDFGIIKTVVGKWLDDNLDHNSIYHEKDPFFQNLNEKERLALFGREPYKMPCNPTAENLAQHIQEVTTELLKTYQIQCTDVRVYETENCWADYSVKPK